MVKLNLMSTVNLLHAIYPEMNHEDHSLNWYYSHLIAQLTQLQDDKSVLLSMSELGIRNFSAVRVSKVESGLLYGFTPNIYYIVFSVSNQLWGEYYKISYEHCSQNGVKKVEIFKVEKIHKVVVSYE